MKQKIHFISGLGADQRVFSELELPNVEAIHIKWIPPEEDDTISSYAQKLLVQVNQSQRVTIVGLSFGGMLAVELSRWLPDAQFVLIASAKAPDAIPAYLKKLGNWKIPDKLPWSAFRQANMLTYYFFGLRSKAHKKLLKAILLETEESFFRWAIAAILNWENPPIPKHLIQIHGTKDRILPLVEDKAIYTIEGGGHFMVLDKAIAITAVLEKVLELGLK